jgi:formylglycine-generating enzyme required for sulfatase activity
MEFIRVEPGRFVMGSPVDEIGREAQETQHQVTLSRPYWLGAFEVTQRQWQLVMNENPSRFRVDGESRPVEEVTWFEVQEFLQRLTKRGKGSRFRLPTEAEWEYACRGGTTTAYGMGPVLTPAQANFAESATGGYGHTTTVGSFPPNAWGFHDMHGNVWEWTQDEHCPYGRAPATDPTPVCHSPLKVIRGGSWYFGADSARCALRHTHRPQDRGFSLGLRVVRDRLADHP